MPFKMRVLVLSGPNLNMLGVREPEIYGAVTLPRIEAACRKRGRELGLRVRCRQSNHEGELVTWIQKARGRFEGLIINAAAYTHTSVAIHDALKMLDVPIVEVHLSNPKERESFRHHSYVEPLADKVISGKGADGYREAVDFLAQALGARN